MPRRASRLVRIAQFGFYAAGLVALGYYAGAWVEGRLFQVQRAQQFDEQLHSRTTAERRKSSRQSKALKEGQTVGRLEIPRIGVSVMVVEGVEAGDLGRAAGHIPGTALPGERGNVGIAAHRDTFFRPLDGIRPNDTIRVRTLDGAFRYRVVSTKVVWPRDVQVLKPGAKDTLTLVTCFPFHFVGAAPKRFIVRATRSPGS